jgi:hypothetical protein
MSAIKPIEATLPDKPIAIPGATDPGQASADMSPIDMLTKSKAGQQLMSGIMQNMSKGAQESLEKMKEWGQDDEDDPDPDGDVTG